MSPYALIHVPVELLRLQPQTPDVPRGERAERMLGVVVTLLVVSSAVLASLG